MKRNRMGMVWLELLLVMAASSLLMLAGIGAINRMTDALYRESRMEREAAQMEALRQLFQRAWHRCNAYGEQPELRFVDNGTGNLVSYLRIPYWEEGAQAAVILWNLEGAAGNAAGRLHWEMGEQRVQWDLHDWGPLGVNIGDGDPAHPPIARKLHFWFPEARGAIARRGFMIRADR